MVYTQDKRTQNLRSPSAGETGATEITVDLLEKHHNRGIRRSFD